MFPQNVPIESKGGTNVIGIFIPLAGQHITAHYQQGFLQPDVLRIIHPFPNS